MTSKGQVTIPNSVRKILGLQKGSAVAFGVTKDG
ncbi:MAG: AbrB/MazE/SpoVT family DNA-binding domain-containing protein, partial [Patescibacteria group bacterium]